MDDVPRGPKAAAAVGEALGGLARVSPRKSSTASIQDRNSIKGPVNSKGLSNFGELSHSQQDSIISVHYSGKPSLSHPIHTVLCIDPISPISASSLTGNTLQNTSSDVTSPRALSGVQSHLRGPIAHRISIMDVKRTEAISSPKETHVLPHETTKVPPHSLAIDMCPRKDQASSNQNDQEMNRAPSTAPIGSAKAAPAPVKQKAQVYNESSFRRKTSSEVDGSHSKTSPLRSPLPTSPAHAGISRRRASNLSSVTSRRGRMRFGSESIFRKESEFGGAGGNGGAGAGGALSPSSHSYYRRKNEFDMQRIGELSQEEDEYDFAILLKASRFEETLDTATLLPYEEPITASQAGHGGETDPHSTLYEESFVADEMAFRLMLKKDPQKAKELILKRIVHAGLEVKRLLSLDGRQTLLKVKAPQEILELGAEKMKLKKLRKYDMTWMEFTCELRESFYDYNEKKRVVKFIDSEKQSIVHALLTAESGAGLNEYCALSKYVVKMFPLHKQNLQQLRTRWVTYWRHPRPCSQALLPRVQEQPLTAITSSRRYSETAIGRSYYEDPTAISRPTSILRDNCLTRLVGNCLYQPIDDVAQYYGEKVAFYFAWLEMYTRWLIWPSIAGIILFVLQVRGKSLDQPIAPLYAIFMAFWVSAFLIAWKRRAAVLAYRWGVLGYEDEEITRPEFKGDAAYSTPSTTPGPDIGNAIKKYPAWKRYLKYFVTIPAVIGCIGIVMVITFYAFTTRDRLESKSIQAKALASNIAADLRKDMTLANFKKLSALADADFWFYFLITPILYGLLIPMMDFLFTKIARKMNNWENHRTETRYQSHLILKVFSFRFVHVFASLYYYAFASGANLLRVAIQLASFMIAGQLWKNVMETGFPFFKRRYLIRKKRKATNEQFEQSAIFNLALRGGGTVAATGVNGSGPNVSSGLGLSGLGGGTSDLSGVGMGLGGASGAGLNSVIHEQCVRLEQASDKAWEEAELQKYDTFEDYTEMLIQFGYVSFFSIAFPLAPLLAFLNNLVELRTDAFKVCHAKQRPIAHKASGIGIWFPVLQLMSVLAVLTNCLHIAFTTTQIESLFPNITTENKVWVVFFVEHLVLALKVWMTFIVPSMPSDVKEKVRLEREIAKRESARAIAAKLIHSLQPQTIIEEDEEEEESQEEEEEEEENNHILSPSGDLNLIGGQKKVEEEEEEEEDNNRASNKMQKPIEVPETTTAVSSSSSSSFFTTNVSTNMRNRRPSIGGDNRQ